MQNDPHQPPAKPARFGLRTLTELFDISPTVAISVLLGAALIVTGAVVYFIRSAPPTTITISAGPEGSNFQKSALKYAKILERSGVKLNVLTSQGSIENLHRLLDPNSNVDVGIVQAGLTAPGIENLISLGSISYQPLLVFYRGAPVNLISAFTGKRIAIGPQGSGTRDFALAVLGLNGIKEGGATTLLDLDAADAAKALTDGRVDAAFVMSENAAGSILHDLLHSDEIHIFNFNQVHAYVRKLDYLNPLDMPQGTVDIARNIPPQDVSLLGPMVELVAKKTLHPALSDLILEAASEVHSRPGIFWKRGEFPTPVQHAIHLSEDATRFYKSGKSFLYRFLPFWLASLASRFVVVFIPTFVILVPALRTIPSFFRWKAQSKIHRRYRELLKLEQAFLMEKDPARREALKKRVDHIEESVNRMTISPSFADQFYGLRGHIDFVKQFVMSR